jgi:hypothetical protein
MIRSCSILLPFLVMGVGLAAAPCGMPAPVNAETSPLSGTVESFLLENGTMEDGLSVLRRTNTTKILIGFEKIARRRGEKERAISLSVVNATVGEILNDLCRQDTDYTYELVGGSLIHVYPKNYQSDPAGLLSLRISRFSIVGKMAPAAIIQRIGDLAPELASFMNTKRGEYYAKRGLSPGGSPGSILSGNMDPEIHLELHDMTVREILNAVVLYSRQLMDQTPADIGGNKIPPTSWTYEFIIDPDASTGLGGTPHWKAF